MSLHASRTRWRSVTRRLYVATRKSPITTMTARTIQIATLLPFLQASRPMLEEFLDRLRDAVGIDTGGVQKLGGLAGRRHLGDREGPEGGLRTGESGGHGLAPAA